MNYSIRKSLCQCKKTQNREKIRLNCKKPIDKTVLDGYNIYCRILCQPNWRWVIVILDMRSMLRGETDHIHIDYLLSPDLPDGAEFEGDAHVVGDVTDAAGYMSLKLTATVSYN